MKKYRCVVCDWVYDPAVGDPDGGIAPGTAFEEIPEDWVCPVGGAGRDHAEEGAESRLGNRTAGAPPGCGVRPFFGGGGSPTGCRRKGGGPAQKKGRASAQPFGRRSVRRVS